MNSPRSIRTRDPVTATQLRLNHGNRGEIITRHCPPDYQSKSGRVKRWTAAASDFANRLNYGIRGRTAATLRIVCLGPRTDLRRIRAFGTANAMEHLLATAVRTWHALPGGREIETLFDRMFPEKIELEVTPLVVAATGKSAKPLRE